MKEFGKTSAPKEARPLSKGTGLSAEQPKEGFLSSIFTERLSKEPFADIPHISDVPKDYKGPVAICGPVGAGPFDKNKE